MFDSFDLNRNSSRTIFREKNKTTNLFIVSIERLVLVLGTIRTNEVSDEQGSIENTQWQSGKSYSMASCNLEGKLSNTSYVFSTDEPRKEDDLRTSVKIDGSSHR